ncbi:hypothetical protein FRC03_005807 [Tulasnella sp. 419]|nr:hypothetical protein FRC03_005807 [Tulasnella sp. 419]
MHTPSSGGSLSSPDPSPPPVSATAQTSSTLGKSAPIPTKVVSTMPAAGSDASSDLSELSSEAGGSEPPNTIRRRVKERNRDPHSIQSSDDDDEEEEQEDDDDDDQDDSDSTDRPFAPRGAARRTQANVREREKRKASSVPKQNPRASSSRTRSPAKSITAKNKQSQHQNNKPVTAPARPTSHRRQKSNNTNYSSSTAAHPQSSSSNGISHNHNHNHRTTSPSAFAQSANYAGMVDASSDNDDPSSNTRSSRRKKRGFVPGAMWDWAIKKPNSKKENSKHSTGADSSKSPADEDDEQEEEPPTPGAASHGIATLPDERDEDVKPDIQALDLTLADQKISQATNESNTSSATAVSITANNENHVAVPIAVKSVDCASPSMQKAKLEDGKSDPNLPAKGNGPVPPPCVNGVLPSADQSDAMDIDEPTEAHTASSDNPVKEPENGQGLDVLAAMAGLSDVTSNAPADATSREDKTGGDKVDKAMTTKEEGNQKGADDDPDEDEEEEEEEEGSGDKDKDNDREQDDENDNGPDPDEDDEVEEVEDEAEEEEEDTAKTKKVEDDTSTAPPAEIEVDHAPEEQEEQEEPEPDVDNEQELEGEPEIDRAAADAADEVEAETEIQPTQRAEALDILATMEIKFALLREKIYVDKMEEIAREEEMILNGSHPEYLHLLGELQQRRDRKLNLASVKRAREEEFIHLRRRNEERAVWSWWNEIQETTRDEMVRDANAKRRRLDREKRTLEHPRLVRSIPQPPTSHVEVPPNQTLKQTLKQHTTHFQRYPSSSSHPRETPGILPISAKEIAADLELLNPRRYSASGGSGGHHVHRTSSSIGPAPSHMNQYVPPPPPPSNSISGHYGSHSSSHGYAGPSGSSQGRYIPPASYGQVVDAAAAAANPGSGSGGYSHMGYPDGAYPPPPPLQHHYGGHPPNQHSYGPPPPSSQQPYPPPPAQQGLQPQPHHYPQSGSSQQPPLPPPSLSPMPPQNGSTYSHPPPRTNGWPNGTGSAKDGKVVIDLTVEPLPSDSRPPSSLRQHGSSGSVHLPPPPRPQSAFQQPASSQMSPPANGVLSPPGPPPPLTPRPMTSSSNPGRITSPTASYFGSPSRMSTSGGGLGLSPPRRTSAATPQPQSQSLQRQQSSPMVPLKRAPTPLISGGSKVGSQGMVFTSTIPPPLPPLVSERAGGDGAP